MSEVRDVAEIIAVNVAWLDGHYYTQLLLAASQPAE